MSMNVIMPEMGEGVDEGTVINWLVSEGDYVQEDAALLEVETDKVTVEINAEVAGTLLKIMVPAGQTATAGSVLAVIGEAGEQVEETTAADDTPAESAPAPQEAAQSDAIDAPAGGRTFDGVRVSPVVARMVREHDLDVTQITGTGRDGRVTKRDVIAYMEGGQSAPAPQTKPETKPSPAPAKPSTQPPAVPITGDDEIQPLSGMRRAIAEHMVMSKRVSPHVTTVFEFDYSAVAAHRAAHKARYAQDGVKLTYMPYLVSAVAGALKAHPMANASWTDDGIVLKKAVNIGVAVAVPHGLLVPVIRDADTMNLLGLARAINDLADRARTNKLRPDEVQGGTFSITNHGASGSLIGTPIINQPQVGIVGIGVIEKRVKVIGDAIAIRPCAYASFSFDHRILDGATADAFMMDVKHQIENWA
ncbi:MAG: 2-oxo acid dehydrogenase subunit E2 [Anaerolineaceae bacterium]|nr:MAG: 2-oxo acid dehydrogenase subunit E2 [Anaerolineaceae bacterium]